MTTTERAAWIHKLIHAGLEVDEAEYYVDERPAHELPDILQWAANNEVSLDSYDDGPIHGYDY